MPKLLLLPGFLQNASVFAEKSSGLRKILTKKLNYQLDYLDPPTVIAKKEQLPFPLGIEEEDANEKWKKIVDSNLNRCWWLANNPGDYEGFQKAVEFVVDYIRTNGPYDGIIGFSQGAAMSAIIANSIEKLLPSHGQFKVAAYFSAFAFTHSRNKEETLNDVIDKYPDVEEYAKHVEIYDQYLEYFSIPDTFSTKVISVYGSEDGVVPPVRSEYLNSLYPESSLVAFKHDGGHYMPNKKLFLNPIVDQFREVFESKL